MIRRRLQTGVLATALGVAGLGLMPAATSAGTTAAPCGATGVFSQSGTQSTCSYTTPSQNPATDTFTVPAGVTSVRVLAVGAAGASASTAVSSGAAAGGAGAQVTADLLVTGGSVLDVDVGVGGGQGHNAGGDGGGLAGLYTDSTTAAASAVIVAGGGGGGGGPGCDGHSTTPLPPPCTPDTIGDAGAGAGSGATSTCNGGGEADGHGAATAQDGGGGTCSTGGAGGVGTGNAPPGSPGSGGQGGGGGGGGGAGYFGGGGGAQRNCQILPDGNGGSFSSCTSEGGGGGGSSFAGLGTSNVAMVPGSGGPSVSVSWTDRDLGITNVPGNITTSATDSTGATVSYTNPTAVDDSVDNPGPTVGCAPASGSHFDLGTTTVTCKATDSDDANSPVSAGFTVTVTPAADLAVYLSANPNPAKVGGTLTYTITIQNSGPSAASSVQVSDTLPSTVQMTAQPLTQGGHAGTCHAPPPGSTGTLTCALTSFASGTSAWTVTAVVRVVAAPKKGAISDAASVGSSTADPTVTDNSATVTTQVR